MKKGSVILRKIFIIIVVALTFCVLATNVQAGFWPYNIGSLETYLEDNGASYILFTGDLEGSYYVAPLAYEAGHTNIFFGKEGTPLFSNQATSALLGLPDNFGDFKFVSDMNEAYFSDSSTSGSGNNFFVNDDRNLVSDVNEYGVLVYQLTADWTVPNGDSSTTLTLEAGTFIIGFNDVYSDDNHDDFILYAKAAVPIPTSIWLLGSSMLGFLFMRRKMMNS